MNRQPIISVLGHVDHGKTMLLDKIRGTTVAKREHGKITQHIGATEIPIQIIKKISSNLLTKFGFKLEIPGLLFIDTPGHEAFTSLRKRGGSISDLAILVIDITQGMQKQTIEAINILRNYKVPFIVAANKIDKIGFWESKNGSFLENEKNQTTKAKQKIDEKIYDLVGQLYNQKFSSERFDRCTNFTTQIPIIPCSAITGEGIPEILMLLAGLSQKYLKQKISVKENEEPEATILEVTEEKGLGTTINIILYKGTLRQGNQILVGTRKGAIKTRIRAILKPRPLQEIRDKKTVFMHVKETHAASGVKIAAPNLENAVSGMPIKIYSKENEKNIVKEIKSITIHGSTGVILKADTLGSLEALTYIFKNKKIEIKKADLGTITKQDVLEAKSVSEKNKYIGVIFGFNTKTDQIAKKTAEKENVKIFKGNVIYKIIEEYEEWVETEKEREKKELLARISYPCKFRFLKNYVFRRKDPAVIGTRIIEGKLRAGTKSISEKGKQLGKILKIESNNKQVEQAKKGDEVAVSIEKAVIGKNLKPGELIYTLITEKQKEEILNKLELSPEEKKLLEEIIKIKQLKEEGEN